MLEPYKGSATRYMCPQCKNRRDTFKRYIDSETGAYLADHVGKCDRIESCGYHYPPAAFFADNPGEKPAGNRARTTPVANNNYHLLKWSLVERSMKSFGRNHLVQFLCRMFGPEQTKELVLKYCIGTAAHWPGATVFWQLDHHEKVRAGKIMLYDAATGKRVKEPFNHVTWVHRVLMPNSEFQMRNEDKNNSAVDISHSACKSNSEFKLRQCFFGEHLLAHYPQLPVAIVESEKTAVIAAGSLPQYVWLAAGSLEGLSDDKCQVLAHRQVILFPDANAYHKWQQKARELSLRIPTASFYVDDYLESNANADERQRGIDIADRFIDEFLTKNPKN